MIQRTNREREEYDKGVAWARVNMREALGIPDVKK